MRSLCLCGSRPNGLYSDSRIRTRESRRNGVLHATNAARLTRHANENDPPRFSSESRLFPGRGHTAAPSHALSLQPDRVVIWTHETASPRPQIPQDTGALTRIDSTVGSLKLPDDRVCSASQHASACCNACCTCSSRSVTICGVASGTIAVDSKDSPIRSACSVPQTSLELFVNSVRAMIVRAIHDCRYGSVSD